METIDNIWSISLSLREVYLLCSLLNETNLVGFEHLFTGWAVENVQIEMEKAKDLLSAKGWLQHNPDGSISIDQVLAGILDYASNAKHSFMISQENPLDAHTNTVFYISPALIEQEIDQAGTLTFTIYRDAVTYKQRILGMIHLETGPVPYPIYKVSTGKFTTDQEPLFVSNRISGSELTDQVKKYLDEILPVESM